MVKDQTSNRFKAESKRKNTEKSVEGKTKKRKNQQQQGTQSSTLIQINRKPKLKIIEQIESAIGNKLPEHEKLGLWRKDLSLLTRIHLAPFVKLLEMEEAQECCLNPITGYLSSKRKSNKNQIVVEMQKFDQFSPNNKRSILIKMGEFPILLATQNICFYRLTYAEFVKLFSGDKSYSENLGAIFRSLKDVSQEESPEFIEIDENETILWPVTLMETLNFQKDVVEELVSNFKFNPAETDKLINKIKTTKVIASNNQEMESYGNLDSRKSISEIKMDKMREFEDPIDQYLDESSVKPKSKLNLNMEVEQMNDGEPENKNLSVNAQNLKKVQNMEHPQSNQESNLQDKSQVNNKSLHQKSVIQEKEYVTQKKFCIWLIGTSHYLFRNEGLISWESVPAENCHQIFTKTKMSCLLPSVNQVLSSLNKYEKMGRLTPRPEDFRQFLNRLSHLEKKNSEGEIIETNVPCIPLRFQNPKQGNKRVLVRRFHLSSIPQSLNMESSLEWILLEELVTSYHLPIISKQELTLLYLAKLMPHAQIISNYFYRNFYCLNSSEQAAELTQKQVRRIFREFYPQFLLTQDEVQFKRCIYCIYAMRDMEYETCFFCKKFSHRECCKDLGRSEQADKNKNPYQNGFSIVNYPQNQSEGEFQGSRWICETCQPCSLCLQAVGEQYFKCNICFNYLHLECGKLKGYDDTQPAVYSEQYKAKYICKFCLKCIMCNNKLRDQEHMLVGDDYFCKNCYDVIQNNEHCHICRKQNHDLSNWIQCQCSKWVHNQCDPDYFKKFSKQVVQQDQRYLCPFCRKKQIRNVYVELIRALSVFDEFQFFTEPSYDSIPMYRTIIDEPMCFLKMKEKALSGFYDEKPLDLIKYDFYLIVNNALKFNMPKDSAHLQAKILKIMGELAFDRLKQFFTPDIQLIINNQVWTQILKSRRQLHNHINEHYPELLINYGSNKSYIEIRKRPSTATNATLTPNLISPIPNPTIPNSAISQPIFHSPLILNNLFKHSTVLFHLKKVRAKIQSLFTIPKSQNQIGSWLPIKGLVCYFHNDSTNIIFTCSQCFESYCCVQKCYKHRVCTGCGIKGCGCDDYQCGCPPGALRQKEKKGIKQKLIRKYSQETCYKSTRELELDLTQNYKYCWKCVRDNISQRHCVYCDKICSYNYKICQNFGCNRVWHFKCSNPHSKISEYPTFCKFCLQDHHHKESVMNTLEQCLVLETRSKLIKLSKIQRYMKIFLDTYRYLGIRLNPPQIQLLILDHYDQFSIRQNLFIQYEINFELMRKYKSIKSSQTHHMSIDYSKNFQDQLKLASLQQQIHEKEEGNLLNHYGGPLCYEKDYLFRCKSIWWKFFKNNYIFDISAFTDRNFHSVNIVRRQKYKTLTVVCRPPKYPNLDHFSGQIDPIQKFESCLFHSFPILQNESGSINHLNEFTEITIKEIRRRIIQQISSPQNPNLFDYYSFLNHQSDKAINSLIQQSGLILSSQADNKFEFGKTPIFFPQSIQLPSRNISNQDYSADFKPVPPSIYLSTMKQSYYYKKNKYEFSLLHKPRPVPHKYHYNPIIKRKGEVNEKVSTFLQAIYQRSKCALRKGNTSILKGNLSHINQSNNSGHKSWVVLKRWGKHIFNNQAQMNLEEIGHLGLNIHEILKKKNQLMHECLYGIKEYIIRLEKVANIWNLEIENCYHPSTEELNHNKRPLPKKFIVYEIEDIINHINKEMGCKLETFKDLGQFLGFTIYEPFYQASHFTHFLQTNIVDDMPFMARVEKIKQLYDSYEWGQDGFSYKTCKASELGHTGNSMFCESKDAPVRIEYNSAKVKPYYLSKRKSQKNKSNKNFRDGFVTLKEDRETRKAPYITFEDLKKHFEPSLPITNPKNEVSINLKNPYILNEVFIAPSKIHKLGLFSRKSVKKGTVMIEYVGQMICEDMANRREKQYHYGCYMFGLGKHQNSNSNANSEKKQIIDATFRGNMARYLNHSCDPNCRAKTEQINGVPRIFIYTIKDIPEYSQLTYDYQFNVDADEKLECTCGAKNCQGRLN